MAKKYFSLEEAAEILGIKAEDLNQLREKREIRAFSDRGSWKFRPEDVENLKRSRQFDSSEKTELTDPSDDSDSDFGSDLLDDGDSGADIVLGDSGADMVLDDGDDSHPDEHSTIVRRRDTDESSSDSDVKLVFDDALLADDAGSSEEISLSPIGESDSDVRLTADSSIDGGSDSDVKLVGGSSVEIEKLGSGSDSDVSLVGSSSDDSSDSDVQLIQSNENEAEHFVAPPTNMESEYDVSLGSEVSEDSEGSSVMADDSGLSLEDDDSGISLESDSGISLATDSGISLADDSGLSLAGDSGISLVGPDDSGISLDGTDDKTEAFSVMDGSDPTATDGNDTHLEVPAVVDEESDFEFSTNLLDTDSETSVITLDDDEIADEAGVFEESEVLDFEDDGFDDDVFTEGEEIDLIGAGEEDFDDAMLTGESHAGLGTPAGRMAQPVEQEWGVGTHIGLWIGALTMAAGLLMMFDVVNTMWGDAHPDQEAQTGFFINFVSGLF